MATVVPDKKTTAVVVPIEKPTVLPTTPDDKNLENLILQSREKEVLEAAFKNIEDRLGSQEEPGEKEVDENDPLGVRILSGAKAVGTDIVRGIVESPAMVVRGVRDAAQETINSLDEIGVWLNDNVFGDFPELEVRGVKPAKLPEGGTQLPEMDDPESVTGAIISGMSQFLISWVPLLRGVKAVTGGKVASTSGQIAQASLTGGAVYATAFDPYDKRLANLIEDFPDLSNPVTRYFQSSPDDTRAEARLKAGLEGIVIGLGAEVIIRGFVGAVRAIRNRRIERGVDPKKPLETPDEAIDKKFGDPKESFITDEGAKAFLVGKVDKTGALPFKMNWARLTGEKQIDEALDTVARLFTKEIDEARRGVITDKELTKLAHRLDLTPEDLLARQTGKIWTAEKLKAAQFILDASLKNVKKLAKASWDNRNEVDDFLFLKMFNTHVALQAQYQGLVSEAGRALRVARGFGGSRQKQFQELDELLMAQGGPDQVRRLAKAVSEITDPRLVDRLILGSIGKRIGDMIIEAWYFMLLSGPVTQVVNATTSQAMLLWSIPQRAIAAQFNKIRGAAGVEVGEATAMTRGWLDTLGESFRMAGRTLRTGEQKEFIAGTGARTKPEGLGRAITGTKFFGKEFPVGTTMWYASKAFSGIGEYVFRMPQRVLMTSDEFFRWSAVSMSNKAVSLRIAKREGLEGVELAKRIVELERNPTKAMLEEGLALADSFTFLTPLGKRGKQFQAFINTWPLLKLPIPFVRTPVNLTKWAGKSTPIGLLSKGVRADIKAGGVKGDLALAQMAMGGSLVLVWANEALKGNITGAGPYAGNKALHNTWRRTHQPFSIKMPFDIPAEGIKAGDWISYNRTDPFGLLLGAAASYAEVFGTAGPEELDEIAVALSVATAKSVFSKTWMQGPTDLLDALSQPEIHMKKWAQKQIGTLLVPTGAKQITQAIDPVWREVNSLQDAIYSRTPGFSQELNPMTNVWGQDILLQGGLGPDIMSPYYKFGQEERPIDDWLVENQVNISMPAKIQTFGGVDLELTDDEYYRYKQLQGNVTKAPGTDLGLYDTLNAVVTGEHSLSSTWDKGTDGPEGSRETMVRKIVRTFREAARFQLLQENVELQERVDARRAEKIRLFNFGPGE